MSVAAGALPRLLAGAGGDGGRGAGPGSRGVDSRGRGAGAVTLPDHVALHGLASLDRKAAADLAELAERAGLRGRGGAAFPTARKLRALAGARGPLRLRSLAVVANGVEAEPASAKDRVLLTHAPHLVLDGLQLAALVLGAERTWIAVPAGASAARTALDAALAERAAVGRDPVAVEVVPVPDRFVAGEERAVVNALGGGPAIPTTARPWQRGVDGAPTLVQNVETLAHLALIAAHGPDWFRAVGDPGEPGSTLVTVSGAVTRPGVREVPMGMPLAALLDGAGGALGGGPDAADGLRGAAVVPGVGDRDRFGRDAGPRALLVGGYAGGWLSPEVAAGARLLRGDLVPLGATVGCGAVVALPASACPVAEVARLTRWLADESAGQCGPCVFGLDALAGGLASLCAPARPRRDPLPDLRRWCGDVAGRGACGHPDGVVRMVRSALRVFAAELDDHARHGACDRCAAAPVLPLPPRREPLPLRTAPPRGWTGRAAVATPRRRAVAPGSAAA